MEKITKLIIVFALSLSTITIVFGYILLNMQNTLIAFIEEAKTDLVTEQQREEQSLPQLPSLPSQSREDIKNTSQNTMTSLQTNNETSTLPSSISSPTINPQDRIGIFPSDFIQIALVPDISLVISVILRTMIISSLVFIIIKWLGGKGMSQLSPFALIILIGLGSAVGDPMIYKDMSIPQAMAAVIVVVIFFKIIDFLTSKFNRFKKFVEPKPILLINGGIVDEDGLKKAKIDRKDFEAQMRLKGISTASEIKTSYLESNGQISFIIKK